MIYRALCATCVRQDFLRPARPCEHLQPGRRPALPEPAPWDADFPLQRDSSKCIKCMRCVAICEEGAALRGVGLHGGGAVHEDHRTRQPAHRRGRVRPCAASASPIAPPGRLPARDDVRPHHGGHPGSGGGNRRAGGARPCARPGARAWGFPARRRRRDAWPRPCTPWASIASSTPTSPPTSPLWKRAASSWNSSAPTRPPPCSRAAVPAGCAS